MARNKKFLGNRVKRRSVKRKKKLARVNWLGKKSQRKIEVDLDLLAYWSAASTIGEYCLAVVAGVPTVPLRMISLISDQTAVTGYPTLVNETEFLSECEDYAFFKINGVGLTYRRAWMPNTNAFAGTSASPGLPAGAPYTFSNVPAFSLGVVPGGFTANLPTAANIWDYDNNLKVQNINEDSKPVSKYFGFPGVYFSAANSNAAPPANSSCQPLCGNKLWIGTQTIRAGLTNFDDNLVLLCGYIDPPIITANAGANTWCRMGTITVTFYLTFSVPIVHPTPA